VAAMRANAEITDDRQLFRSSSSRENSRGLTMMTGSDRVGVRAKRHRGRVLGRRTVQGGKGTVTGVVLSLLLVGIINNVLTLTDVASEGLRIVTGSLLIISILLPNLIASASVDASGPPRDGVGRFGFHP
jgi:hypothetical protein